MTANIKAWLALEQAVSDALLSICKKLEQENHKLKKRLTCVEARNQQRRNKP